MGLSHKRPELHQARLPWSEAVRCIALEAQRVGSANAILMIIDCANRTASQTQLLRYPHELAKWLYWVTTYFCMTSAVAQLQVDQEYHINLHPAADMGCIALWSTWSDLVLIFN